MVIRKFSKDELVKLMGLPYDPSDDVEIIRDELDGQGRWETSHDLIFKYENKFYRTSYSVGSTEYQDERPWEYENVIDCIEVEPFERTIVDYRAVK